MQISRVFCQLCVFYSADAGPLICQWLVDFTTFPIERAGAYTSVNVCRGHARIHLFSIMHKNALHWRFHVVMFVARSTDKNTKMQLKLQCKQMQGDISHFWQTCIKISLLFPIPYTCPFPIPIPVPFSIYVRMCVHISTPANWRATSKDCKSSDARTWAGIENSTGYRPL